MASTTAEQRLRIHSGWVDVDRRRTSPPCPALTGQAIDEPQRTASSLRFRHRAPSPCSVIQLCRDAALRGRHMMTLRGASWRGSGSGRDSWACFNQEDIDHEAAKGPRGEQTAQRQERARLAVVAVVVACVLCRGVSATEWCRVYCRHLTSATPCMWCMWCSVVSVMLAPRKGGGETERRRFGRHRPGSRLVWNRRRQGC